MYADIIYCYADVWNQLYIFCFKIRIEISEKEWFTSALSDNQIKFLMQ